MFSIFPTKSVKACKALCTFMDSAKLSVEDKEKLEDMALYLLQCESEKK